MAKPKLKQHHINRDWCKGCGICVHFCPKKVLELDEHDKVVAVQAAGLRLLQTLRAAVPGFGDRGTDGAGVIWAAH